MPDIIKGLLVIAFLVILLMIPNIKFVSKDKAYVIERLGRFLKIIHKPGVYILIPLLDRVIQIVSLDTLEKTFIFHDEETKIEIKIYIKYQIFDIKLFVYAELDSIGSLRKYIENHIYRQEQINLNEKHLINEYAEGLGIEITEMCFK
ncbi:MAG: hypothetical protein KKG64_04090 [Firmicutes bacterium]|nr:hypothetical protein [Bacillota bacterium]